MPAMSVVRRQYQRLGKSLRHTAYLKPRQLLSSRGLLHLRKCKEEERKLVLCVWVMVHVNELVELISEGSGAVRAHTVKDASNGICPFFWPYVLYGLARPQRAETIPGIVEQKLFLSTPQVNSTFKYFLSVLLLGSRSLHLPA